LEKKFSQGFSKSIMEDEIIIMPIITQNNPTPIARKRKFFFSTNTWAD